jgi:hypothetical protein
MKTEEYLGIISQVNQFSSSRKSDDLREAKGRNGNNEKGDKS